MRHVLFPEEVAELARKRALHAAFCAACVESGSRWCRDSCDLRPDAPPRCPARTNAAKAIPPAKGARPWT
ncbi:hypothetical protein [Desulfatitalea tepidiphila]|uniref:hypothetical protein n=1 Tax=Desulfatitalea tepidiphila TaxID=1185843 RepID=UPI0006B5F5DC|nr:hypothetical protein [Desulfatitalea tepidiphila]